jgi:hypothetical protein
MPEGTDFIAPGVPRCGPAVCGKRHRSDPDWLQARQPVSQRRAGETGCRDHPPRRLHRPAHARAAAAGRCTALRLPGPGPAARHLAHAEKPVPDATKASTDSVTDTQADLARRSSFALSPSVTKHMCLGQPSRVPGGPIPAVRKMGQMFPIIRRPCGCLLYADISGARSWGGVIPVGTRNWGRRTAGTADDGWVRRGGGWGHPDGRTGAGPDEGSAVRGLHLSGVDAQGRQRSRCSRAL